MDSLLLRGSNFGLAAGLPANQILPQPELNTGMPEQRPQRCLKDSDSFTEHSVDTFYDLTLMQ